jgi:predicted nucleotide-binding protein (sugar kinase/HSP70/actin superfamily)
MNQTLYSDITHDLVMREIYKPIPELMPDEKTTKTGIIKEYLEENFERLNQLKDQTEELLSQLGVEKRVEVHITNETLLFCANESLINFLGLFEKLIKQHFLTVDSIDFTIEYDPELGEKWVSADTKISGEIDQVIKWEDSFIKDWVSVAPYPEREKIRLSCDII